MQFDQFVGFFAVGDVITFRPINGPEVEVCHAPPDIDAHMMAEFLNTHANTVFAIVRAFSSYKF